MKRFNNEGYTLLELMITILIGSIITLATTTILLLGLRLNNESTDTVEKQNTARILLSALEDLATEGTIGEINYTTDSWEIIRKDSTDVIFSYDAVSKTIYTGSTGTPLLEDVIASHVFLNGDQVLTFSIETDKGTYTSSVYCRTATQETVKKEELLTDFSPNKITMDTGVDTSVARTTFLKVLASQYGSTGYIKPYTYPDTNPIITIVPDTLEYYVQKYNSTWELDTPWCAIFLSWALDYLDGNYVNNAPSESHVSKYEEYFKKDETDACDWKINNPIPGDIIFFDWDPEKNNGYDHVGVVLKTETKTEEGVEKTIIYTIEGNTANMVAVRSYDINDPDIVGYGVLDWKKNP